MRHWRAGGSGGVAADTCLAFNRNAVSCLCKYGAYPDPYDMMHESIHLTHWRTFAIFRPAKGKNLFIQANENMTKKLEEQAGRDRPGRDNPLLLIQFPNNEGGTRWVDRKKA